MTSSVLNLPPRLSSHSASAVRSRSSSISTPSDPPVFEVDRFHHSFFAASTADERLHALAALKKSPQSRSSDELRAIAKFLQTLDPFSALSPALLSSLASLCHHRLFRSHSVIYQSGEPATTVYAILTGSVGTLIERVEMDEDEERLKEIEKFERERERIRKMNEERLESDDEEEEKANKQESSDVDNLPLNSGSKADLSTLLDSFISMSANTNQPGSGHIAMSNSFTHGGQRISSAVLTAGSVFGAEGLLKDSGSGTGAHFKTSVKRSHSRLALERSDLLAIDIYEYHHMLHESSISEMKEKLLFLYRQPMLQGVSPQELYCIAMRLTVKEFHDKHEIVFKQGEVADRVYFIRSGQVRIIHKVVRNMPKSREREREKFASGLSSQRSGSDQSSEGSPPLTSTHRSEAYYAALQSQLQQPGQLLELAVLGPNQYFGELGVLNYSPRTCSAVTAGPTTCFAISKEEFHSLFPVRSKDFLKVFCSQMYRDVRTLGSDWREEQDWIKFKDSLVSDVRRKKKL